ncbi:MULTISPECIES: ABC transporter permease [unclassified Duganella]|uniref:ABC transporter permease n=1 Tax=unclassified Duganella TaxID=2636909 RepID=UPI00088C6150|nr:MULTISPECIES: ABC transporter permease [unclassified Duganella]SDG71841.1 sodium transport system permease protein [Duganella sp. OV458]SDJ97681.1 sodium transport system permease protein [Duganella sp. OV510]
MWTIYLKELLELVRDRRTFFFTVFVPVFAMPLIFTGFGFLTSSMFKQASTADMAYAVFGKEHAPQLAERLAQEKGFHEIVLASPDEIKSAIAAERIKFALVIPPGMTEQLAQQQQGVIQLHYNSAATIDLTRRRVATILADHNSELREQALSALRLNKQQLAFALDPVKLEEHSTANKREQMGAIIGGMLPYILLMVCLMAAMYPAIDTGAGEKERGTLETLLLAPVSRTAIVLAKFLMLFTIGLTSALLMIVSVGLLLHFFGQAIGGDLVLMVRAIGPLDLAMVALMLVPTAAIFAAILLSISVYAKSYKEATGMISPLIIVTILPTLVALLPGVELNWRWAMVPLTNVSLAMKELVKGTMDYSMFSVILLSTTVTAGLLLAVCRWWFNREQVLFRN